MKFVDNSFALISRPTKINIPPEFEGWKVIEFPPRSKPVKAAKPEHKITNIDLRCQGRI